MNTVTAVAAGVVTVALVAAVAVLTWHGSIDGQAAVAFFSGIAGGAVVGGAHAAGVQGGVRAARRAQAPITAADADRLGY